MQLMIALAGRYVRPTYQHPGYRFGSNLVEQVSKRGQVVVG